MSGRVEAETWGTRCPTPRVNYDLDDAIATITNDNPEKHNAFDDAMDLALFESSAT